jgi:hypothetical protein
MSHKFQMFCNHAAREKRGNAKHLLGIDEEYAGSAPVIELLVLTIFPRGL